MKIPSKKSGNPYGDVVKEINTKNILFVCGGAFTGLEKIIQDRIGGKTLGFNSVSKTRKKEENFIVNNLDSLDLIKFGLIPELIGRLPMVCVFDELSEDDLLSILIDPINSLTKQFTKLFYNDGVDLIFDYEALRLIASIAHKNGSGARGLRKIMEETLNEVMYQVFSDEQIIECTITKETVEHRGEEYVFEIAKEDLKIMRGEK